MAAVTQAITVQLTAVDQFSGQHGVGRNSIYPRARMVFNDGASVTAKGAGDTKTLSLNFFLPVNYAYVLDSMYIEMHDIGATDTDNYANLGALEIGYNDPGTLVDVFSQMVSQGDGFGSTIADSSKVWIPLNPFREIVHSRMPGSGPQFSVILQDVDGVNASTSMVVQIYSSFLQYDIMQVTEVVVNAPQPVIAR